MAKNKSKKIKVILVRGMAGKREKDKKVLQGLGLKKINQVVEHVPSPNILGMIRKVQHLVKVEGE
ncbi:MAG TPA: 50S ribosomal protein L30 [Spirochaetota bacterium]|nr:50S ribosomal protein L30 [Spirochaetota bacterium]HOM37932.1 50S ribosomal protein L30 [Spirochaetota bacterium]HPQ48736.1 50S ribosomal protein L30 [Spirochaetota bacterium]